MSNDDEDISKDLERSPGMPQDEECHDSVQTPAAEHVTDDDQDFGGMPFVKNTSNAETYSPLHRTREEGDPSLGQLGNLTHSAIGDHSRKLPCVSLVASMPRTEWLLQLKRTGYAGLLYADMQGIQDQEGFQMDWWFNNRNQLTRRLVRTPLESVACAGVFTLNAILPGGSILNSVIAMVAELIGSDKTATYCASTLQMFVPSEGGFSQDFRLDDFQVTSNSSIYRCFWYLGPKTVITSSDVPKQSQRECIFIGSAGDNVKEFSCQKVVTLAGYYGEANRKFRLHPGDILIMDTKYPFAVDLPIGGRAKGARVLSWHVFPKDDSSPFPRVMCNSEIVANIEDIVSSNEEARKFYNVEIDGFEINPGPIGDPEGFMQRLRVTPSKYELKDIIEEVEKNPSILYVNTEYFIS